MGNGGMEDQIKLCHTATYKMDRHKYRSNLAGLTVNGDNWCHEWMIVIRDRIVTERKIHHIHCILSLATVSCRHVLQPTV